MTGRVIAGRYNLQHPIGRGAMGVVWRARDQLLDRDVAVKEVVISALIGADERRNAYQRTLREARTAARLSHRGVVAVYDVAEEDGRPWIVMELVPSQSLDQVLVVEGRLPPARAGRIGQQLLSALAAAHSAGVLHRDVKPSNVLIAINKTGEGWEERAVLTDFGIAQFEGDPRLTQTGMVMGSPGFTAPERIRGSDATPASDLWSLGATIYAAVEGRGPYEQRGGAITTMSAIINEDAPIAPHAGRLAPVIAVLLRRDPSTRPSASAAARMFAQALPHLADVTEEPPAMSHPPTVRSTYVPPPADPVVSTPVTAPEGARSEEKPAPAAQEEPAVNAAAEPAKEAEESPSAEGAAEAAPAVSAEAAEEAGSAEAAKADLRAKADSRARSEPAAEAEPAPAAETAEFKASAAVPVPEAADAKAAADSAVAESKVPAESKAAAAAESKAAPESTAAPESKVAGAPLDARSGAEEARSRSAETVIPGKGPAGYQPTQVSIPAARITPPTPAQPKATPLQPAEPKPAPAKPGPTFTAAKPTGRPAPTFSAASRVTPPRPARPLTPPPDQRPAYGASSAGQGYPPPQGGTTPFASPGTSYGPAGGAGPAGGQYAGPAQPYPDLVRQYTPGTGGRAGRGRGQGRRILWLVLAVIVAAAIGVGTALALNSNSGNTGAASAGNTGNAVPSVADTPSGFMSVDALNDPSTALPAGWSTQTVTAAAAHSAAAGFSIDVPPGWTETRKDLATDFTGPGDLLLEVDLTQQPTSNMLTAAKQVEAATHFRDYKRLNLQAEPVRHAEGAVWKFNWTPAGGVQLTVDDIFFAQQTSAGVQDYAVYVRSPSSTFGSKSLPLFDKMLQTFQTVAS
jgi:eukaryotic-like serine/threonine-protein kinase